MIIFRIARGSGHNYADAPHALRLKRLRLAGLSGEYWPFSRVFKRIWLVRAGPDIADELCIAQLCPKAAQMNDLVRSNSLFEIGAWIRAARNARLTARAEYQKAHDNRRAVSIEAMIADMERTANQLDREIEAEQIRTGISDPAHFAYSMFAKAAAARRDNLRRSVSSLRSHIQQPALRFASRETLPHALANASATEIEAPASWF
jgi:hypothetical protein